MDSFIGRPLAGTPFRNCHYLPTASSPSLRGKQRTLAVFFYKNLSGSQTKFLLGGDKTTTKSMLPLPTGKSRPRYPGFIGGRLNANKQRNVSWDWATHHQCSEIYLVGRNTTAQKVVSRGSPSSIRVHC
jgi:hypothetical protein